MPWLIIGYILLLFVGAAVALGLAVVAWRRRGSVPGMTPMTVLLLGLAEWCVCYLLFLLSADFSSRVFWFKALFLGSGVFAPAALVFALQFSGRGRWVTPGTLALLAIEPLISWTLIATGDGYALFWSAFGPDPNGEFPYLVYQRGPWGQVRLLYIYIIEAGAMLALLLSLPRSSPLYRRQTVALLLATVFPWAGSLLTASGLSPLGRLDLTPGGFALAVMLWGAAVIQRGLFNVVPVARYAVIEGMADAVIVVNTQDRVIDLNPAAQRLLGQNAVAGLGRPIWEALAAWPEVIARLYSPAGDAAEVTLEIGPGPRAYEFRIVAWRDAEDQFLGRLIMAHDVTARREAEELAVLNAFITATNQSLQVADVVLTLRQLMQEKLSVAAGWVFLTDEAAGQLALQTSWGLPEALVDAYQTCDLRAFPGAAAVVEQRVTLHHQAVRGGTTWTSALCFPLLAQGEVQGVVELFSPSPDIFSGHRLTFFAVVGQDVGAAIRNARLYEQVDAGSKELQRLSQQLVEVQETERRYLASELHDEIGQALTALRLALGRAQSHAQNGAALPLQEAQALVNDLIQKVRQLSLDLRPAMLDDLGLVPALLWQFERYTAQTRIQVAFSSAGLAGRLPAAVETTAYRVVQEALTNVARHAGVTEAVVRLWTDGFNLGLQVEDNGAGFAVAAALTSGTTSGLTGMRQRVAAVGGQFTIESAPGSGTRVWAELPLGPLRQEPEQEERHDLRVARR